MPVIRPITDLKNKFSEISDLCHTEKEPVFITRQGRVDMVLMSYAYYESLTNLMDLYRKLDEAEAADCAGEKGISHEEMMKRLRDRIFKHPQKIWLDECFELMDKANGNSIGIHWKREDVYDV